MRLPKPIYEGLPVFLVAVGILFITLVFNRYEYAPTLFTLLLGFFSVVAGVALFAFRMFCRMRSAQRDD